MSFDDDMSRYEGLTSISVELTDSIGTQLIDVPQKPNMPFRTHRAIAIVALAMCGFDTIAGKVDDLMKRVHVDSGEPLKVYVS